MCLKTIEKVDKSKDKKHTGILSKPEDNGDLLILHVRFDTSTAAS